MNRIIGKPFNSICRIVDLLGLYFGDDVEVELSRGLQQKPQFSLHIQTQWRFRKDERILLASRDIYTPFDPSADADWRFDIVGREPAQSSVFDAISIYFVSYFYFDFRVIVAAPTPLPETLSTISPACFVV